MLIFYSLTAQCQIPAFGNGLSSSQCNVGEYLNHDETCVFTCNVGFTPLTLTTEDTVTCQSGTQLSLPTCQGN